METQARIKKKQKEHEGRKKRRKEGKMERRKTKEICKIAIFSTT